VVRAFRALDFRVVVDEFLTDTAREADIVLPAKTFFEQTDVIGAYWHDYLQLRPQVIAPPGEVKPESEVYRLLAARLGVPPDEVDAAIPAADRVESFLAEQLAGVAGGTVTLDALREGPVRVPGMDEVAFADLRFATPSGRIELWSEEARTRWGAHPLPGFVEPVEWPGRSSRAAGRETAGATGARHPLALLTPNTKNRIHSQFGNLQTMKAIEPRPVLTIGHVDAVARGIVTGRRVRVFNDRGSLVVEASVDHGMKPGCVSIPNGWWLSDGGAVNVLSKARETDMGFGAAFHENLVEVEPA
jgi:anaerobic selenocysteine-containing dehydrogenase